MIHCIGLHDLDFERVPVPFGSERGALQLRWVRVGMPYIPQEVINGVFYLYASKEEAEAGRNPGGTGFVARFDGTPLPNDVPGYHFYGVTNWHVACDGGFSVIRLNTQDGGTDIIDLGPEDWHFLPGKYDIAVVPLFLDDAIHKVSSVSTQEFDIQPPSDPRWHPPYRIGVGDDVFMIGLFVDHNGVTTNVPSARFGHISMLPSPNATIRQPTSYRGESYVIDMHSRYGFSGSPVYVYRTFGSDLTRGWLGHDFEEITLDGIEHFVLDLGSASGEIPMQGDIRGSGRLRVSTLFRLLGIHWGQFPEEWELRKGQPRISESRKKTLITKGEYVRMMSGMTCVIPAWHIMEVFQMPQLKEMRHQTSSRVVFRHEPEPERASDAAAAATSGEENPDHREDFNRLVSAASKRKPKDDRK